RLRQQVVQPERSEQRFSRGPDIDRRNAVDARTDTGASGQGKRRQREKSPRAARRTISVQHFTPVFKVGYVRAGGSFGGQVTDALAFRGSRVQLNVCALIERMLSVEQVKASFQSGLYSAEVILTKAALLETLLPLLRVVNRDIGMDDSDEQPVDAEGYQWG